MAATTQYNDQRTSGTNKNLNAFLAGATIKKAYGTITIPQGTEADSLAVLADKISPDAIIHTIKTVNSAAGEGDLADNDIVIRHSHDLSKPKTDDVLLADGVSMADARTTMTEILGANLTLDKTKSLKEHLSMGADAIGGYLALVLLMNDAADAATDTTVDYEIEYSSPS